MATDRIERMSPARAADIAELAEEVSTARFPSKRVEPAAIADTLSITQSFNSYADAFDGMLEHRAGRFHIYVNTSRVGHKDSPRSRFTLAHELGHYFIDDHRIALASGRAPSHKSVCEYRSKSVVEAEADHFASNLLMPRPAFLGQVKKLSVGLPGIRKIANHFGTSVTSTAIRYASLEITPCAVIKWDDLAFGWKWLSQRMFEAKLFRTIETVEDLPKDSPTAKALRGEQSPTGFFEAGTTAAAWFKAVAPDGSRNALLMEQAMQLGQYGVLTLLFPLSSR